MLVGAKKQKGKEMYSNGVLYCLLLRFGFAAFLPFVLRWLAVVWRRLVFRPRFSLVCGASFGSRSLVCYAGPFVSPAVPSSSLRPSARLVVSFWPTANTAQSVVLVNFPPLPSSPQKPLYKKKI